MKKSLRAKRMERQHARNHVQSLNLTPLIDVFTVLLFFLMINTADGTQIVDTESLKMPVSNAVNIPKQVIVLQVDANAIVLEGRKVADMADVFASSELIIPALDEELKFQAARQPALTEEEKELGRAITIQADKELSYDILKKVMSTCAMAEYRNISLAVSMRGRDK